MVKIFSVVALIIISTAAGFWSYKSFSDSRTAYVNISDIYDSYPLKKELEEKLEKQQKDREKVLDSMKQELHALSLELQAKKDDHKLRIFEVKREALYHKEQQLSQEAEIQMDTYKGQIWKQLNQYIKEFGDQNGYEYIFGADDSYHLLYRSEGKDVTESLKSFLTSKYMGLSGK